MDIVAALKVIAEYERSGNGVSVVRHRDGWVLTADGNEVDIDESFVKRMAEDYMWAYSPG